MLFIEAREIERLAKIGDIASTKDKPSKGLDFLGTIIVDPGKILGSPYPKKEDLPVVEEPLGKRTKIFEASPDWSMPPAIFI